jgi:hypothetical protein
MRAKNNEPLFLLTSDKNQCLKNIDEVWKIAEPCISSLINYLSITTIDDFEKTRLCLQDNPSLNENDRRTVMVFRIIHTHLRYIDDFRKYVFFLSQKKQINFNFADLNKEIIDRQKQYIDKLSKLCNVKPGRYNYENKKLEFTTNLEEQIKAGYNQYISILNDNRNLPSDNP